MSNALFPPNASVFERDVDSVIARAAELPVSFQSLINPHTCPAEFLPWLAWAMSVDEWRDSWSEQQKRSVIASSFRIHQSKGTLGAIKLAIRSLGYQLSVSEWFEYGGAPYTFRVDIGIDDEDIPASAIVQLQRIVDAAKNVRSKLDTVSINTNARISGHSASAELVGQVYRVYSPGTELDEDIINQLELAISSMDRIA